MYLHPAPLAFTVEGLIEGKLNLQDYINSQCDRIDELDGEIEALLPEPGRRARLISEAEALENIYPHPDSRPPLYGALVGVKDIFHVEGFITRANTRIDPEEFSGPEADCVTFLRQSGALILGKTVTTEFAYFEPGPTRNPHNLNHTPGGSSSGSAAAVAAGFCPLALGTQTIGSVNRPAAYCGVVGFKPSYKRIPTEGLIHFSPSADHVGLFTQDVAGMILASEALCYNWQEISVTYQPVLGVPRGKYLEQQVSPEGLKAFHGQIESLREAGYTIKEVSILDDLETIAYWHRKLISAEMALEHRDLYTRFADLYRPQTAGLIKEGQKVSEEELEQARKKQKELRDELESTMWEKGVSLWIAPAAPGPAPEGIQSTGDPGLSLPWTNAGLPALTVPAGRSDRGLPLGLQLVAPFMGDELLLYWAEDIAEIFEEYQAFKV